MINKILNVMNIEIIPLGNYKTKNKVSCGCLVKQHLFLFLSIKQISVQFISINWTVKVCSLIPCIS
jgi:hypothetical protein